MNIESKQDTESADILDAIPPGRQSVFSNNEQYAQEALPQLESIYQELRVVNFSNAKARSLFGPFYGAVKKIAEGEIQSLPPKMIDLVIDFQQEIMSLRSKYGSFTAYPAVMTARAELDQLQGQFGFLTSVIENLGC